LVCESLGIYRSNEFCFICCLTQAWLQWKFVTC